MYLILAIVLLVLWLGILFVLHITSGIVHLLLILALIALIVNFVGRKRI